MNKNFVINQSVYLVHNNRFYDLHNDYKLGQLSIVSSMKEVLIGWIRCDKDWVNKDNCQEITIVFKGVSYFEISPNFVQLSADTIEEAGYKDPSDFNLDWLVFEDQHDLAQHLIFRLFEDDEYIRIYSESVKFCIESEMLKESINLSSQD